MVKVTILGSTGMLGNAVTSVFMADKHFDVSASFRRHELKTNDKSFYFDALNTDFSEIPKCDYLINCIGIIKPHMNKDEQSSIYINSIFPHKLSDWCKQNGTKLIHITTDCVFSGVSGFYTEESPS